MSKSLGNVIDPYAIVDEYGTDALRIFLAYHIHPFEDSDFTMEKFKESYNADLANGLGNLVSRIMKMSEDNLSTTPISDKVSSATYNKAIEQFDIKCAIDVVWEFIAYADREIQKQEPFKLIKIDKDKATEIIKVLVKRLWTISELLEPFMPITAQEIQKCIIDNKKPENLFPRKD